MINEFPLRTDLIEILRYIYPTFTIIALDSKGPRPNLPYIGFRIQSLVSIGHDEITPPDASGNRTIRGNREFLWRIEMYYTVGSKGNPLGELAQLKIRKLDINWIDYINERDLVYVDSGPIRKVPKLTGTLYEDRAFIDLRMRLGETHDLTNQPWIEFVDINGEVLDNQNNVLKTINISNIP